MTLDPARVEQVARAMCSAFGADPDQIVPATGYKNAPLIPRWRHEQEWAIRHLAAQQALTENGAA